MTEQLKFEVGKHYRTRDGKKATVLLIRPTYMVGEIKDRLDSPYIWQPGGNWHLEAMPYSCDLVAEWREPARVMVRVYRNYVSGELMATDSGIQVNPDGWQLIAHREIVEGEGL
jgi:hypothetical protein